MTTGAAVTTSPLNRGFKEMPMTHPNPQETREIEDRRKFLTACGRFAVVTPPAMTLLLSTSLTSTAITSSGGKGDDKDKHPNNGGGNGGGDGSPNGHDDTDR